MLFLFGSTMSRRLGVRFAHIGALLRLAVAAGSRKVIDAALAVEPDDGVRRASGLGLPVGLEFAGGGRCGGRLWRGRRGWRGRGARGGGRRWGRGGSWRGSCAAARYRLGSGAAGRDEVLLLLTRGFDRILVLGIFRIAVLRALAAARRGGCRRRRGGRRRRRCAALLL